MILLDVASKHRPNMDPDLLRVRILAEQEKRELAPKEAAERAGISVWSWYKKASGEVDFSWEEGVRFGSGIGAPTLWPIYDWAHAADIDDRLGWVER
jgi:hypothetical protein